MDCTITRRSLAFSPQAYPHGWLLMSLASAQFFAVLQLPTDWSALGILRILLLGGFGYAVSLAMNNIPVRGSVLTQGRVAFLGRLAQFGYLPLPPSASVDGELYERRGGVFEAHAGTIMVGPENGDSFNVTVPLRFYRLLKRMQQ